MLDAGLVVDYKLLESVDLRNLMIGTGVGPQEMTAVFGDTLRLGGINVQALNKAQIVAVILPIVFFYPFVHRYFI